MPGLKVSSEIVGKRDTELPWAEQAPLYNADDLLVMESGVGKENYEEPQDHSCGKRIWLRTTKVPLLDAVGETIGVLGMYEDITTYKEVSLEQERLRERQLALKEEIISAQELTLRELSAPLIPLGDGMIALVITGAMDAVRGAKLMAKLLDGIEAHRAKISIIDVTGVGHVGAESAAVLAQATRAARLLGARVMVTGIAPEVAIKLVEMNVDFGGAAILRNLKAGVEFALRVGGVRTASA
jgi:rsbT co-antagonist protein RsbR